MLKNFSYVLYKILFLFDKFFQLIFSKSFLSWFKVFLHQDSYKSIKILDKKFTFFVPNKLTEWRVDTFFSKEPETLEWINGFDKNQEIIFWDIGANIGLFSLYTSLKHDKSKTFAFEPSTSNLRVLSRNISINNFENKIKIIPMPLNKRENNFSMMYESDFMEGGALNSFDKEVDFEGKKFQSNVKYNVIGTSINYLLQNKILQIPDYIKIDVDGLEHLILEGADQFLYNKKIKSLSIEINENYLEHYEKILSIMEKNQFKILHKKNNQYMISSKNFNKTYNYIFIR
mgnify:CR=1 FL=1|tara:strand:- start:4763 stop:5623 length:861 start_codon:yes stop_codon:yes gene_type:complete